MAWLGVVMPGWPLLNWRQEEEVGQEGCAELRQCQETEEDSENGRVPRAHFPASRARDHSGLGWALIWLPALGGEEEIPEMKAGARVI